MLDMKDSTLYVVNGLLMAAFFFLARVVANGAGLVHLWVIRSTPCFPKLSRVNLK